MKLTLLGIMGSIPGGSSDLGINTTCLKVEEENNCILIDSGTGILNYFLSTQENEHHLLFTHYHLDHIVGLPFVKQIYQPNQTFHLYGPQFDVYNTSTILPDFLKRPFLPIGLSTIQSTMNHHILMDQSTYTINGFTIETLVVDHPGKAMVYTIMKNNKKLAILTDFPNQVSNKEDVLSLINNADMMYIDAFFTEEEFNTNLNYGHSTIEQAIEIAHMANVKKVLIGHQPHHRKYSDISHYESNNIIIAKEQTTYTI